MSDFQSILDEADDEIEPTVETTEQPTAEPDEVAAVAESPAPEQTESPEQAPVAEEAQPITREDGATWSDKAQRWYKDGKIVAGEAPAAPAEPSVPSVPEPVAAVEPPPAAAAPTYEGEPWQVRGGGQRHVIPGAIVGKDGWVHLSPEHQAQHKALIASGIEFTTNWQREKQQYTQRMQEAEAIGTAKAQKFDRAAMEFARAVIGVKDAEPTLLTTLLQELPQEVHQTLMRTWQREASYLTRDVGHILRQADLEIPRAPQAPEPQPEQIEQQFSASLGSYVDELFEDAPKGVLSPEDAKDIRDAIAARMAAYAAEVDGQIMLDTHAVKRDFDREVKIIQRANATAIKAAEDAKKAKAAAAFNAANTPKTPGSAPAKPKPKPVAAATAPSALKPSWDKQYNDIWRSDDSDDE